eukprot:CAMPEP_0197584390 /NCGR_PEP_ID=MMETSP1326-20131121/7025_1 /TAXON_ID=1155430 /ORGANISM="Genus nov. species nov., Strain RCC2288" /LENGTH=174 /DNA_ID=CAMNT_0043148751 /DNA_START=193 /DNA_END=714 /DNA_ORIENTATION=-
MALQQQWPMSASRLRPWAGGSSRTAPVCSATSRHYRSSCLHTSSALSAQSSTPSSSSSTSDQKAKSKSSAAAVAVMRRLPRADVGDGPTYAIDIGGAPGSSTSGGSVPPRAAHLRFLSLNPGGTRFAILYKELDATTADDDKNNNTDGSGGGGGSYNVGELEPAAATNASGGAE